MTVSDETETSGIIHRDLLASRLALFYITAERREPRGSADDDRPVALDVVTYQLVTVHTLSLLTAPVPTQTPVSPVFSTHIFLLIV